MRNEYYLHSKATSTNLLQIVGEINIYIIFFVFVMVIIVYPVLITFVVFNSNFRQVFSMWCWMILACPRPCVSYLSVNWKYPACPVTWWEGGMLKWGSWMTGFKMMWLCNSYVIAMKLCSVPLSARASAGPANIQTRPDTALHVCSISTKSIHSCGQAVIRTDMSASGYFDPEEVGHTSLLRTQSCDTRL